MWGARTTGRFRSLVRDRLLPALPDLGFPGRLPDTLAVAEAHGVLWVLDLDVAPWSNPSDVSFTVVWGVYVPGIEEVVGDPVPATVTIDACQVRGCTGARGNGVDPLWFRLRRVPAPAAPLFDASVANRVLGAIATEVVPELRQLSTPVEVQQRLHAGLACSRGAPSPAELLRIRRIAALSLLLGDRDNAARWLEFLASRSSVAMAPDLVAANMAPLWRRLAS